MIISKICDVLLAQSIFDFVPGKFLSHSGLSGRVNQNSMSFSRQFLSENYFSRTAKWLFRNLSKVSYTKTFENYPNNIRKALCTISGQMRI